MPKVSATANAELIRLYTTDEVQQTLNEMHPLKSSGPDKTSTDFRPISLCNVVYKIASKAIANHLKPLLNDIIFPSQSTFVPDRLITDNVLVDHELNHFLAHKYWGKTGHVSLKLDISKAYDRVEWYFLERVFSRAGDFIKGILFLPICSCFVLRCLVGGDPGRLTGVAVSRSGPWVSHLLFADDTLIFYWAVEEELWCVKSTLRRFEEVPDLAINLQKSVVVFSKNTSEEHREALGKFLGIPVVD
ncbi:UNVERIFIED_CONTAM: hypothetical protein Slati_3858500 [Sesamum latifolium]|uniref:Reverse transcriptase domain-containing protein n=1 Tax=Sesamum latifolium TaxID=2727402 RepID=A0AAW2TPA8_9LAMI